jgi:hypothetical protein
VSASIIKVLLSREPGVGPVAKAARELICNVRVEKEKYI